MAKKKASLSADDIMLAQRRQLMGMDLEQPKLALGSKSYVDISIPIPLVMQYFLDVQGLPLGLLYQLTGDKGCRKTTLLMEMFRQVGAMQGMGYFALTEGKYSSSLAEAICGYPDEPHVRIAPFVSDDMSEWQAYISKRVEQCNDTMDKGFTGPDGTKYPPSMYAPVIFGVDSAVAQLTADQGKKVKEEGGSPRGFATHIKALSEWISQIQAAIACRPYVVCLINHCEINQITEWQTEIKLKGGRKLAYESSLIIQVKAAAPKYSVVVEDGWTPQQVDYTVTTKLLKSSIGDQNRSMTVPVRERIQQVAPGDARQRVTFRWGQALINLLLSRMNAGVDIFRFPSGMDTAGMNKWCRDRIMAVAPFEEVSGKKEHYICTKYTGDKLPITGDELGGLMSNDPEFVMMFRDMFGIKRSRIWKRGENYVDVVREERQKMYDARTFVPTTIVEE